ncbi:MAG: tRNA pseudouridine(38-40) synthase TruA [Bacteroidia bacterium]|nr:tRNA pseudouridine(38-40) synthase TruA [Bacteroidia bacterium]
MFKKTYYYLISIQYLGYRFHGWQKQPQLKTIQLMIERTLKYILNNQSFKILGAGRTDAMVSAQKAAFELFLTDEPLVDLDAFLSDFNHNLPQDIRALGIKEVNAEFNIIQDSKEKEYIYLFAHGDKFHPFCAPIMTTILDRLDVDVMTRGAALFQGKHNFKSYCYKPSDDGQFIREISSCELVENKLFEANFFPETSYMLKVRGKGFGRNQVRLMMGALIDLGKGKISLDHIKNSLLPEYEIVMDYIAPASGLILNEVEF